MVAMHPRLPRALLSILAACFVLHHAMTPVATCAPKACGNVRIECPFWLTEHGSQPCGPPAFQVHCRGGRASLARSFRGGYKILRISNADRTVVVANDDVQTDGAGCPVPRIDVTASNSLAPLSASSANRQLVFLFNCTVPQAAGFVNVTCPGTRAVVRLDERYNTTEARAVAGGCDYAVVPVAGSSTAASAGVEYPRLLREGHLLEWGTSARDCGQTFASVCADGSSRPARCHAKKSINKVILTARWRQFLGLSSTSLSGNPLTELFIYELLLWILLHVISYIWMTLMLFAGLLF